MLETHQWICVRSEPSLTRASHKEAQCAAALFKLQNWSSSDNPCKQWFPFFFDTTSTAIS